MIYKASGVVRHGCRTTSVVLRSIFIYEICVFLKTFRPSWSHQLSLCPQERDPSSVRSATSPPPRSPTYRGTSVSTRGRNRTAAPGATTGTGSLTRLQLVSPMAANRGTNDKGVDGWVGVGGCVWCMYVSE